MLTRNPDPKGGAAVDLTSLWTMTGFNVRMLDVRMMRMASEQLAKLELSPASVSALLVLDGNQALSLGKLADALLVQRPNMTKLVKRLIAKGLVQRDSAAGDRRQIELRLTAAGRRLALKARGVLDECDKKWLATLKPAEREQFALMIRRITATLERHDKRP